MAESLRIVPSATRVSAYAQMLPQLRALIADESDLTANQANVSAALSAQFGFHWIGFYRVQGDELVLGPFQGPVACTRIGKGRGVCGTAWERGATVIVPDVDLFPGHIACSARSRSEIVLPYFDSNGVVAGVLDIDSERLDDFSEVDRVWLEEVVALLV